MDSQANDLREGPLRQSLEKIESLLPFQQMMRGGKSLLVEGLWEAPKALLIALAEKATGKSVLILSASSQKSEHLFTDLPTFTASPLLEYPAWEALTEEALPPLPDESGERFSTLHKLLEKREPVILIAPLQALFQRVPKPSDPSHLLLNLKLGQTLAFEELVRRIEALGYKRQPQVVEKGTFVTRGGILDIFSLQHTTPLRIEFWDDEIVSIRSFDPIHQRSTQKEEGCWICPANEWQSLERDSSHLSLLNYLGQETLIVLDDLELLEERYHELLPLFKGRQKLFHTRGMEELLQSPWQKLFFTQNPLHTLTPVEVVEESLSTSLIRFDFFNKSLEANYFPHPFQSLKEYTERPEHFADLVVSMEKKGITPTFLCTSLTEENVLKSQLPLDTPTGHAYLSSSLIIPEAHFAIIPTVEVTHRYRLRRKKQRQIAHSPLPDSYELRVGDYVVHLHHGIGRYLGMQKRKNAQGLDTEYFHIEYAQGGQLFVPLDQSHLISQYVGIGYSTPTLHSLGGKKWRATRQVAKRAVMSFAADLLKIYAAREKRLGPPYLPDSLDMTLFEEEFPYEETEDQLLAIEAIKKDLLSSRPMERLICGDVGFGKTEVAMRAAFKVVLDGGRQVAVLVPTTVLAMQHFETFTKRMQSWGLSIGLLSRFCPPKEAKAVIEGLANGSVDIVIGTHKLISRDIQFKNLGLVIIDEEQRFGVKAKEHLKTLKTGVDCLTLSATPIPRTLHLCLAGAKDLSVINTPPYDRLPIKSFLVEHRDSLIQEAIRREIRREGQVFFIHNRVDTIATVCHNLQSLVPEARFGFVHGQMDSEAIDEAFHAFSQGQIQVLVATSIVESGLDIPNANTILIDNAHHFGLSELYQLKGRVGRWNRQAFAYFLVPSKQTLPPVAKDRLETLTSTVGFGGGFKIALKDLEIRGAGDLLGLEQSGHASSIGFHLYCQLLQRSVDALQGKRAFSLTDIKIDFQPAASLSESYIEPIQFRMDFHRRFGVALELKEVDELWEEMIDRFGKPPKEALWLYHFNRIWIFGLFLQGPLSL